MPPPTTGLWVTLSFHSSKVEIEHMNDFKIMISATFVVRYIKLNWTDNLGFKENVKNVSLYLCMSGCSSESYPFQEFHQFTKLKPGPTEIIYHRLPIIDKPFCQWKLVLNFIVAKSLKSSLKFPLSITNLESLMQTSFLFFWSVSECWVTGAFVQPADVSPARLN